MSVSTEQANALGAQRVGPPREKIVDVLKDVREALEDKYDVDQQTVGEGDTLYKERPYQGAGLHIQMLRHCIAALGGSELSVLSPATRSKAQDAVIAECRRDWGPANEEEWIGALAMMVVEARNAKPRQVVQVADPETSFSVFADAAEADVSPEMQTFLDSEDVEPELVDPLRDAPDYVRRAEAMEER